jgi:hypothetical protein
MGYSWSRTAFGSKWAAKQLLHLEPGRRTAFLYNTLTRKIPMSLDTECRILGCPFNAWGPLKKDIPAQIYCRGDKREVGVGKYGI